MNKRSQLGLTLKGEMQINLLLLEGTRESIRALLQYSLDFDAKDKRVDRQQFHILALNENSEILVELQNKTFNVNARNENGSTPLFGAVISGNVSSVRFFTEKRC